MKSGDKMFLIALAIVAIFFMVVGWVGAATKVKCYEAAKVNQSLRCD